MMEGLQLWKKFEELKSRACDEVGYFIVKPEILAINIINIEQSVLTNTFLADLGKTWSL